MKSITWVAIVTATALLLVVAVSPITPATSAHRGMASNTTVPMADTSSPAPSEPATASSMPAAIAGSCVSAPGQTGFYDDFDDFCLATTSVPQTTGSAWYSYANGDDILVLEMQGDILWAGTRAGGLVRWDTRTGTFVQYLKPQDDLAGNTVRDIYIDAEGNKWLATDDGLSVLDDNGTPGKADDIWYTFNYWSISSYFPSSRITAVAMDEAGFLWLGTSQYWDTEAQAYTGGGLVKIDTKGTLIPADDEWLQTYTVENTILSDHRKVAEIRDVGRNPAELIAVAALPSYPPMYVPLLKRSTIQEPIAVATLPPYPPPATPTPTPTGDESPTPVWPTVTPAPATPTPTSTGDEVILGLASDNITDILPVPGNRIWIATQKHWAFRQFDTGNPGRWLQIYGGLSRLDHAGTPDTEDDTWQTWTCEAGPQWSRDVSCTIHELKLDANGYVWAAQRGRGVIAFPANNSDRRLGYVRFDKYDGLATSSVESVAFGPPDDPQWRNTIWLGTYGRGVSVLDHKGTLQVKDDDTWNDRLPVPGEHITTANGLPDDRVQAMVVGAGKIWMGTGGMFGKAGGIGAFDLARQVFLRPLITAGSGPSIPRQGPSTGPSIDSGGASGRRSGQAGLRPALSRSPEPAEGAAEVTGLPYNYIADLAVGQPGTRWENQVWVATGNKRERRYGVGALLLNTQGTLDPADDTWTHFTKENTDDDGQAPWTGLASNNITAIAINGDYVWFGTQPVTWDVLSGQWTDGGLSVYDGERWTVRTVENTGGEPIGLRSNAISTIAVGCYGEIWIALGRPYDSSGGGIDVLDTGGDPHDLSNDRWWEPIRYPTIPSNLVTGITPDCAGGHVWISTGPYFTGSGMLGGGVARYDYTTGEWTWWTTSEGIESYTGDGISGQVESIAVGPDGRVWAGGWGTRYLSRQDLLDHWPYVPAVVNWFRDGVWSSQVFENDGWVSSIAIDELRVVWAGTSRGGLDFDADGKADDRLAGRAVGGIKHTVDGTWWGAWTPENSPLVTNDIEVIKAAPDGAVWVGTNGWGLMRFGARIPVIPLRIEVVSSATALKVDETLELEVRVHNQSTDATFDAPRFRLRIKQDLNAPVIEPAQPAPVSQPVTIEPGASASASFTLRAVRAGTATLNLDVIGEAGLLSAGRRYTTGVSARPVTITVRGQFYLPLIIARTELHSR